MDSRIRGNDGGGSEWIAAQRRFGGSVFGFHAGNQFGGTWHIVDGADAARFLGAVKTRLEAAQFESQLGL